MLYLLDANILITASNSYYPIDQVPEFWNWLRHQGTLGLAKIPIEVMEEIQAGRRDNDLLIDWISDADNEAVLLLKEEVDGNVVQRVVSEGYANDLTDDEVEKLGRDPFLMAYALADATERCIVTTEISRPAAQRQTERYLTCAAP